MSFLFMVNIQFSVKDVELFRGFFSQLYLLIYFSFVIVSGFDKVGHSFEYAGTRTHG